MINTERTPDRLDDVIKAVGMTPDDPLHDRTTFIEAVLNYATSKKDADMEEWCCKTLNALWQESMEDERNDVDLQAAYEQFDDELPFD